MRLQFWDYNLGLVSIGPVVPEVNGNLLIPAVSVEIKESVIQDGSMKLIYSPAPIDGLSLSLA